MLQIQNFDAENSSTTDTSVPVYLVDTDGFFYSGIGSVFSQEVNVRKGKSRLPAVGITGYLSVKNSVAYYLHANTLNVSTDKGDNWQSYEMPASSYDCMCLSGANDIFVGASNGVNGIAISNDSGKTWKQVPNGVTGNLEIYTINAAGFMLQGNWVAAGTNHGVLLSHDNGQNWTLLSHVNNPKILDSKIGKIYFDESYIFLIQEAGISHGQLRVDTTNNLSVDWADPYTDIPYWYYKVPFEKDNIGEMLFRGNAQIDIALMNTVSGSFVGYDWPYRGGPIDIGALPESNPYAKGEHGVMRQTVPRLKMPETMSELMAVYFLSPHRVISVWDSLHLSWNKWSFTVTSS